MKVLIVGAGAVGQVYGKLLHDGGAEVTFLVKEKYAADLRAATSKGAQPGLVFYPRRTGHPGGALKALRWAGFKVATEVAPVASGPASDSVYDVVMLAVSSTALYSGGGQWVDQLLAALGGATLVMLQPGLEDRAYLLGKLGAARASQLVEGSINVVAYHAPMQAHGSRPAEKHPEPGMAYWFPPGKMLFSGERARLERIFAVFRAGGLAVAESPDLQKENAVGQPALTVLVCALEASGWSFDALMAGPNLGLASMATQEAIEVFAALRKMPPPPAPVRFITTRPAFFRTLLRGSKYIVPFDFENYLHAHFTKVREQMHQALRDFIRHGQKLGIETGSIQKLLGKL